jgi:SPP1 gp7 family putative phage head morphogenesis protein
MVLNPFIKLQLPTKPKLKKPKIWLYPRNAEREYERQLIKINRILIEQIKLTILPNLGRLVAQSKINRPERQDDWSDDIEQLVNATFLNFEAIVSTPLLNQIALEQALRINGYNKEQFFKTVESAISVNPLMNEPYIQEQLKAFQKNNTNLITKFTQEQKDRLNNELYQSLSSGRGAKEIARDIQDIEGIGKRRAILIARDQTNKFNGQLTQLRQTEMGVEEYRWVTAHDERVRPSHKARDGKVYRWDSSDIKPGEEIRCRCIAQPIISDSLFE